MGRLNYSLDFEWHNYTVPNGEDFLSGGLVQGRLYHVTFGNANHQMLTDYIELTTANESFTALSGSSPIDLTVDNNRYFQYRYDFGRDVTTFSPQLYNVTIVSDDASAIPSFSSITATNINETTTNITWTTSSLSNSTINYGTTLSLGSLAGQDDSVLNHSVQLSGLLEDTLYYYNITSCVPLGCNTTGTFNFTSATNPIVISNLDVSLTHSKAIITWTTDPHGNSSVCYGLNSSLGQCETSNDLVTSHSITLHGLTSETYYYYNVSSIHPDDNSIDSVSGAFTTLPTPDYEDYITVYALIVALGLIFLFFAFQTQHFFFAMMSGIMFTLVGISLLSRGIPSIQDTFIINTVGVVITGIGFFILALTSYEWAREGIGR